MVLFSLNKLFISKKIMTKQLNMKRYSALIKTSCMTKHAILHRIVRVTEQMIRISNQCFQLSCVPILKLDNK